MADKMRLDLLLVEQGLIRAGHRVVLGAVEAGHRDLTPVSQLADGQL